MTEIILREKDFVVVDKPYGWLSEYREGEENVPQDIAKLLGVPIEQVYTVHRLDRTTEGLMVYGLTKKGAAELSDAIAGGLLTKIYTAYITADEELPESGEMEDMLYFDRRRDKSFVVKGERQGAKKARLQYEITDKPDYRGKEISVAKVRLMTGRTHQIRVQFASRKSPLIGDGKYGSKVNFKGASLMSTELEFPFAGKTWRFEREKKELL